MLQQSQELFELYYPKKDQKNEILLKVVTEITKQLFSNELQVIAGVTGHYTKKMDQIKESKGKMVTLQDKKTPPPQAYRHPIYLNNPNYVKKKRLVITKDEISQTVESEFKSRMTESAIESKVASKLVQMLMTKGATKIIKKYGYLPTNYIKNENQQKAIEGAAGMINKKKTIKQLL